MENVKTDSDRSLFFLWAVCYHDDRGMKMETMKIGNITLTWLDGGVTHMDGGAMFGVVPKPLWSKKYPVNEKPD